MPAAGCPLCDADGGRLVLRTPHWRLVHAGEAGFPGFYRLVWNEHVAEFSDLSAPQRALCMNGVVAVEQALRTHLRPAKINLATLGNMVPHLHWHVIARFEWDSHFPAPVWGAAAREAPARHLAEIQGRLADLEEDLRTRLALDSSP